MVQLNYASQFRDRYAIHDPDDIRICILQRGRVVVGYYYNEGMALNSGVIMGACIRRWSHPEGLSKLSIVGISDEDGTGETVLDFQPQTTWPTQTSVELIRCDTEKWAPLLQAGGMFHLDKNERLPDDKERDIRVCLLQRGRVLLGEFATQGLPGMTRLRRCACIRRWGTDAGIGQLAKYGPRTQTEIDWQGETEWPTLATVETIRCNTRLWGPILDERGHGPSGYDD